MRNLKLFCLIALMLVLVSSALHAKEKTTVYRNRDGSVQFKSVENKSSIKTYDNRGTFSGEYKRSGNNMTQTNKGFSSAKPNSTFSSGRSSSNCRKK